jgi:RNA polymerase sigma factor (sigma-70 family)
MRVSSVYPVSQSSSSSIGMTDNATAPALGTPVATPTLDRQITAGALTDPARPEAATDFESLRCRLFSIAYQLLRRPADAEDVVQDVWVRWQGADQTRVRDRVAFLVTITTRVALNAATSARARHEVSVGRWLPQRDLTCLDPALATERSQALDYAVQLLMQRLSPAERAVYLLREAFDYPFRDIADILALSEANARQLARRARHHLTEQRHHPVDPAQQDSLRQAFLHAAQAGDMTHLINLLSHAVISIQPQPEISNATCR